MVRCTLARRVELVLVVPRVFGDPGSQAELLCSTVPTWKLPGGWFLCLGEWDLSPLSFQKY
jgi:hypothetical protein